MFRAPRLMQPVQKGISLEWHAVTVQPETKLSVNIAYKFISITLKDEQHAGWSFCPCAKSRSLILPECEQTHLPQGYLR